MLTLKQLTLLICCVSSIAVGTESPLPATTPHQEMSSSQIRAGFSILNRNYHEIAGELKALQTQQQAFGNRLEATIKQSLKRGWPLSARLAVASLIALGAWIHKDQFTQENAQATLNSAKATWNERENIIRTLKYSIGSAYHQIGETITERLNKMQKSEKETTEEKSPRE